VGLLTFSINVTLDGCVDHQEGIADDETHAFFTRLMDEEGAMLWGRVTYEMMESYWPAVARGEEEAPPAMRESQDYRSRPDPYQCGLPSTRRLELVSATPLRNGAVATRGGADASHQRAGGAARMLAAWLGRYEADSRLRSIAATLRLRSSGYVSDLIAACERELAAPACEKASLRPLLRRAQAPERRSIRSLGGRILPASMRYNFRMTSWTAVYVEVPEGYAAFVEELPGANAQGATLDEARENLQEAIDLVLEANRTLAEEALAGKHVIREQIPIHG
jgi:predicted RNase H-like HicB family nuclease